VSADSGVVCGAEGIGNSLAKIARIAKEEREWSSEWETIKFFSPFLPWRLCVLARVISSS
jgi:hypothetical protein